MESSSTTTTSSSSSTVIRAIPTGDVRRIVSGQAVVDLASAVKELVENSLDAGARSVSVRLTESGAGVVEVVDDGRGVPAPCRPLMAAKHATSKLSSFSELYERDGARTLGFRGEALFCLANVSGDLTVTTRAAGDAAGERLEFGRDGSLLRATPTARRVGTTVTVRRLFDALPVRRTDLERRIKAQRARAIKLLRAYAALRPGVRFGLTEDKGTVRLATSGRHSDLEGTCREVLGDGFVNGMMRFEADLGKTEKEKNDKKESDDDDDDDDGGDGWRIEGLVSSPSPPRSVSTSTPHHGLQLFSINGRPVDLPKLSRALTDAWRESGRAKRPSCALALTLPNDAYDVNLAPDKRQVLLTREAEACARLKEALTTTVWRRDDETNEFAVRPLQSVGRRWSDPGSLLERFGAVTPLRQGKRSRNDEDERETESSSTPSFLRGLAAADAPARRTRAVDDEPAVPDEVTSSPIVPGVALPPITPQERRRWNSVQRRGLDSSSPAASPLEADLAFLEEEEEEEERRPKKKLFAPEGRRRPDPDEPRLDLDKDDDDDVSATVTPRPPGKASRGPSTRVRDGSAKRGDPTDADEEEGAPPTSELQRFRDGVAKSAEAQDTDDEEEQGETLRPRDGSSRPPQASQQPRSFRDGVEVEDADDDDDDDEEGASRPRSSQVQRFCDGVAESAVAGDTDDDDDNKEGDEEKKADDEPMSDAERPPPPLPPRKLTLAEQVAALKRFRLGAAPEATDPSTTTTAMAKRRPKPLTLKERMEVLRRRRDGPSRNETRDEETTTTMADASTTTTRSTDEDVAIAPASEAKTRSAPSPSATNTKSTLDVEPKPVVVWDHFSDTKTIVREARRARKQAKILRRQLQRDKRKRTRPDDNGGEGDKPVESLALSQRLKPTKNTVTLSKKDFLTLHIIGQFNLGFVLARCRDHHLWILDQHACDEIRNFERLCRDTVVHEQRLLAPLPLDDLSPAERELVVEHEEVFRRNGFRFSRSEDGGALALTALPHSGSGGDGRGKAVQFGREDVSALCALLGARDDDDDDDDDVLSGYCNGADGGSAYGNNAVRRYVGRGAGAGVPRLPKAVAMFAHRACRGSVKFGDALSREEMEGVVRRMHEVERPWTCPHGRPTMRHLKDVLDVTLKSEIAAAKYAAGPSLAILSQDYEEEEEEEEDENNKRRRLGCDNDDAAADVVIGIVEV